VKGWSGIEQLEKKIWVAFKHYKYLVWLVPLAWPKCELVTQLSKFHFLLNFQ
jgi:hypothetical protein